MANLFIIGSGFTKSVINIAPLNNELLTALAGYARDHQEIISHLIGDRNAFAVVRRLREIYGNDIEIALTKLDLDIITRDDAELQMVRNDIGTIIASYFSTLRYGRQVEAVTACTWLNAFITNTFAIGDSIISLNYDCLLEGALDQNGLWTPEGGYGRTKVMESNLKGCDESPISVLKIHGSENFFKEPHADPRYLSFFFEVSNTIYPRTARISPGPNVREWGFDEAIIAPSYVKVLPFALTSLFLEGVKNAKTAIKLIVIGCGLRKEDQLLSTIIWKFYEGVSVNPNKRIIILDPFAQNILDRMEDTFKSRIRSIVDLIPQTVNEGRELLQTCIRRDA